MEWDDVQRLKKSLIEEAVGELSKDEVLFLQWLLDEERKYRFAERGGVRVPKVLRDRIEELFPMPKKAGGGDK